MDGLEATRLIIGGWPGGGPEGGHAHHVRPSTTTSTRRSAPGRAGFLLKDAPRSDLIAAVRAAAEGNGLLAPSVTRLLIEAFRAVARPRSVPAPSPAGLADPPGKRTSCSWSRGGRSNAEIARELFVGEATVKTHIGHLLAKLGAAGPGAGGDPGYETGLVVSRRPARLTPGPGLRPARGSGQAQPPVLPDQVVAEAVMRLRIHQLEAEPLIDAAGRGKDVVGPTGTISG